MMEGGRNDDKSVCVCVSVCVDRYRYIERKKIEKRWDTERRLKETEEEESDK